MGGASTSSLLGMGGAGTASLPGMGGAGSASLPGMGVAGEVSEKLTQMEYLQCYSWVWVCPSSTPAILTSLLE